MVSRLLNKNVKRLSHSVKYNGYKLVRISIIFMCHFKLGPVKLWFHIKVGDPYNYRSGVVAKGFLWIVFCHALFCSVLCR